jgi:hypothetical protein
VSALDDSFSATVRNHVAAGTKPAYVGFGASDAEICVISSFGLKFTVFDLRSSKATEIGSPKVFSSSSASRCFSFRPETRHLALLTRTSGKDMVSIHSYPTRELQRSWAPDTIDAQALAWSPDGRWLVVWDSPAHGHRVLFYTSDGHAFKTWSGPANPSPEDRDYALGAGVKSVEFSADARYLAIGDFSRSVSLLSMASVTETIRLRHPKTLVPKETLQVSELLCLQIACALPWLTRGAVYRSGKSRSLSRMQGPSSTPFFGPHRPSRRRPPCVITRSQFRDARRFLLIPRPSLLPRARTIPPAPSGSGMCRLQSSVQCSSSTEMWPPFRGTLTFRKPCLSDAKATSTMA